ncbi:helix-turn-helix domain-containing protein [Maricaulis sp.]|uniref:helix-turn-helix domain-containing protein n=1 Tax=Maricaulis sp. TaxID=1486257 RepID=UPI00342AFB98
MPPLSIIPSNVAADPSLNATDLRVLIALASFANARTRECFPSQSHLARELGLTRQTVNRAVKRLVGNEWITSEPQILPRRGRTANRYSIRLPGKEKVRHGDVDGRDTPPVADKQTAQKEQRKIIINQQYPRALDENWKPDSAEHELAISNLGFTNEEFEDATREYRAYWRDRSHQPGGQKSDWKSHFRSYLRRIANVWRTSRPSGPKHPGRGRQRASGFADVAARIIRDS